MIGLIQKVWSIILVVKNRKNPVGISNRIFLSNHFLLLGGNESIIKCSSDSKIFFCNISTNFSTSAVEISKSEFNVKCSYPISFCDFSIIFKLTHLSILVI